MSVLDPWKIARDNHAGQLVHVLARGDSTWAGQTREGANYSPLTRVRERIQLAGLTDGGHGFVNGPNDTAAVSLEPADAGYVENTFFNIYDTHGLRGDSPIASATVGGTLTYAAYGTRLRLTYSRFSGGYGPNAFRYRIDGGSWVQVTPGAEQANVWSPDFLYFTGLTYGRHTVQVEVLAGRVDFKLDGTRDVGIVVHNVAQRSANSELVHQQLQDWAGLTVTNSGPATAGALDSRPGARRPSVALYGMGINDQQGGNGVDTSATLYANAKAFAQAMTKAGAPTVICIPWLESANQSQLASAYRAALTAAATDSGSLLVDLSAAEGGALHGKSGDLGGGNSNPHLTALAYQYQGDHLADVLLAAYDYPDSSIGGTRTITGYRLGGQTRALAELRRPVTP